MRLMGLQYVQPFSQKSHTPTVPKEFQIGLHDPAEADLELFWNCCSVGFLGERLYGDYWRLMAVEAVERSGKRPTAMKRGEDRPEGGGRQESTSAYASLSRRTL